MAGSPANHAPEMVPDIQEHLTLPHPHLFKKKKNRETKVCAWSDFIFYKIKQPSFKLDELNIKKNLWKVLHKR